MILKPLLTAALAALLTGTALAAPVLKPEITVSAEIVTVGDMFADAGLFAEEALFRAPRPGTIGTVQVEAVEAAAERIGFTGYSTQGLASIRVARAGTAIGEADLKALIEADLEARGIVTEAMSAQTVFSTPFTGLSAATVADPLDLIVLRYRPGNGTFSARFAVAGIDAPIDVEGTIDLMIEVPHLAEALPAGTILSQDDIVMRSVPLRYADSAGFASADQLIGMALQRQSREGMMLKASDVGVPELVSRNDMVTIYYRSGPLTLTVRGQALSGAAKGEPVEVLNLMSKRVITTTAIARGAVEIATGPLAVAGL
jgi:flagella basal body P-ring formation protein FlgA